ncbi:hypothetical protein SNOG_08126 [Parastagonospora nodorum SN15]|uniref:Uncharacterized protein n=1 Tax=Phaeosphaeria nodorum (strain SN15 / ATCC MYA-4574 / FGSC 10173) TaxID=321614 RepID=Q0UJD8_PHANO|nr:hypothetical protein SNOG_08126 [Parastagonospora nodorum SN15]EAT84402.1 hypothetical protein SNOG_08126 [Parastagonospora nodorum SN15]
MHQVHSDGYQYLPRPAAVDLPKEAPSMEQIPLEAAQLPIQTTHFHAPGSGSHLET